MATLIKWKSGTYALKWRDESGKQCVRSAKTKDGKQAKRELRKWNANQLENESLKESSDLVRLDDAITEYRDDINVKPNTLKLVDISLDNLKSVVGNCDVKEISRKHRPKLRKLLNSKYARTTVNLRNRQIKTFFRWLVNEAGDLDKVPFAIKMEKVDESYKAFTPQDVADLHSFIDDPVIAAYFRYAQQTGYRLDEINKAFINDEGRIEAKGKGGKRRQFPFFEHLKDDWELIKSANYTSERISKACTNTWRRVLLKRHTDHKGIEHMGKEKLLKLVRPVLYKQYGKSNGLDVNNLTNQEKAEAMCTKSFHSFRHTWAEKLYDETNDIYYVSKAIGHSSVAVTQKYERGDVIKRLEQRQPMAQS
jgi:integrase